MHYKKSITAVAVVITSFVCLSFSIGKRNTAFLKIGHRGTRGLMPENTIPSMLKAIELGCNTIEFDVHITKDGQVVVYHDSSVNPEYTQLASGSDIAPGERKKYTFYQMNYSDIRHFKIGLKKYPAFPEQQLTASYAPLLSEMIDSVEAFTATHKYPKVNYLLEIKSSKETDGVEQPVPAVFVEKVMSALKSNKLRDRLVIQSFDMRPLQVLTKKYPKVKLGFLTGDNKVSVEQNLALLGFKPQFYNPHYGMVNTEMVNALHAKGIKICPWTVNELDDINKTLAFNVDGIITDYPDRLAKALK
ncbi:glycerophosphodiester phosphodiesterase family protein [uncultured Mucilaginibacter sp.]|uniref:glycerophosphodiester phosphodiesterase family protein n=1 Tax=uncultured Mucilaginibacter sp. TaxID=797541 RepID=UPI0025F32888|nr:glycerophosphodiester phosphodiesterase family protein [uncultured Mucilaginibacter sp.]